MKLLHTADWHLGKRLEHVSRLPEQRAVMQELCELTDREDPDLVLIAGDVYDQINPSVEATELLYQTMKYMAADGQRAVIAIAGNHDSPDRVEVSDPLARSCGIIMVGYPHSVVKPFRLKSGLEVVHSEPGFVELKVPRVDYPIRLILTPYANEIRLRKYLGAEQDDTALQEALAQHWQQLADKYVDAQGVNLLMTHLFMKGGGEQVYEEDEEERSILTVGGASQVSTKALPAGLDYVALGHLHSYIDVQKEPFPVVYSSSPLMYSAGDKHPQKYAVAVELAPEKPAQVARLPLTQGKPIRSVRFASIEEALQQLPDMQQAWLVCIVETETHLTAQDRKRLLAAHAGIIQLIPEFTDQELLKFTSGKQVDLSQNISELFDAYFTHRKGIPPNEELQSLFREVIAEEESAE